MKTQYIPITSYNTALSLNRLQKIFAWTMAVLAVGVVDYFTSAGRMSWFSVGAFFVYGIMIVKCWADMIVKSEPDKNCWEFKED